jgi:titin
VGANVTTYSDTGLTSNEDYYYKVTAYNSDGESGYSNEDGATTDGPTPPDITLANTDTDQATVDVTDLSTTEEEFRLYRSATSGVSTSDTLAVTRLSTTETDEGHVYSLVDDGLSQDTTYYWAAAAYNSDTSTASTLSNEVSGTTNYIEESGVSAEIAPVTSLPAATEVVVTGVAGDQITVAWADNSSNEDGYEVYVRPDDGSWTLDGSVGPDSTSYTTTALRDGERYHLQVVAYTEDAEVADVAVLAGELREQAETAISGSLATERLAIRDGTTHTNIAAHRVQGADAIDGSLTVRN